MGVGVSKINMALPLKGSKPLAFLPGAIAHDNNRECDYCRLKDKVAEAQTFCINCKKYMCFDCKAEFHETAAHANHKILQGTDIPKERIIKSKISVQSCEIHNFKMIEYYCPKHTEVLCQECKESKHAPCQEVSEIKKLAKGIKGGKDLPKTIQEVRDMMFQFERLKTIKDSHDDRLEEQLSSCLKAIHDLRQKVNNQFDLLERKVRIEIETRISKEKNDIRTVQRECLKMIDILQEQTKHLESAKSSEDSQCFISLINAQHVKSEYVEILQTLLKEKREWQIEFEPSHKLLVFLKSFDKFGSVKSTLAKAPDSSRLFAPSPVQHMGLSSEVFSAVKRGKKMVNCGEHPVSSSEDGKHSCSITGATFMADGRLLLVDHLNNNIKLFDQPLRLKSTLSLNHQPCDVAALNNKEAVITVPEHKKLAFLIMDPDLRINRTVITEEGCQGISVFEKGLLVTCYKHGIYGLVLLLDMEGRVKQRFDRDVNGDSLFQGPFFIATSSKQDKFYVSDKVSNAVLGVTAAGKIVFKYHSKDLDAPGYIVVDKEGAVFVCGRDSKNIHMLSSEGRRLSVFSADGGLEGSAMCYRPTDRLFVICSYNSDRIRTYKLL